MDKTHHKQNRAKDKRESINMLNRLKMLEVLENQQDNIKIRIKIKLGKVPIDPLFKKYFLRAYSLRGRVLGREQRIQSGSTWIE